MIRLLTSLVLALCLSASAWANDDLSLVLPECAAKLERRSQEPTVLLVRSVCPLSLQSLAKLLENGIQKLASEQSLASIDIYLGRLINYPEWSNSLIKVAAKDPTWNSKRGRPTKTGESENLLVRRLLNGSAYPQLLKPLFAQYGYTACIADVEKVLVYKAKEIFPNKTDRPTNISTEARLPVDAQIWLRFQPNPSDCTKL